MHAIKAKNINEAFPLAIMQLREYGVARPSRDGNVLEYPGLFVTEYENPEERILFDKTRDCNPFFHFMESLWMLAGRNDVHFLSKFNSNIHIFSDDGTTFHGAYGYRIRKQFGDQLRTVIKMLSSNKDTRRAVVQIWDALSDLGTVSKDIPCNDLLMFKVRDNKVDMTVCNRSNDLIWGAYGANVVHFSMIHEYVARMSGFHVGKYCQVSDSMHVYTDRPQWEQVRDVCTPVLAHDPYRFNQVNPYPLCQPMTTMEQWEADLRSFFVAPLDEHDYHDPFFTDVVVPMYATWIIHKTSRDGMDVVEQIKAEDWRLACAEWLMRRYEK